MLNRDGASRGSSASVGRNGRVRLTGWLVTGDLCDGIVSICHRRHLTVNTAGQPVGQSLGDMQRRHFLRATLDMSSVDSLAQTTL